MQEASTSETDNQSKEAISLPVLGTLVTPQGLMFTMK